jgi:sugar phosphate isomerase/epimerase
VSAGKIKFGICSELYTDWHLQEIFAHAAKVGFDGVEVAPFTFCERVTDVPPAERRRMRQAAERAGVEIVGLHWLLVKPKGLHISHPDEAIRVATRDYLIAQVHFCADIGGSLMIFGSPGSRNTMEGLPLESARERAALTFSEVMPAAEDRGVTICFEPLSHEITDFMTTAEQARGFIRQVDHPNFRLILDVRAMSTEEKPTPEIIRESADLLRHVHSNDDNGLGPGMGGQDYDGIAQALRDIGYEGYCSVEIFDFSHQPEEIAARSIAFLREKLG